MSIKSIDGGENHTIVLMKNNDIYCWGKNDEGQVGGSEIPLDAIDTPTATNKNAISDKLDISRENLNEDNNANNVNNVNTIPENHNGNNHTNNIDNSEVPDKTFMKPYKLQLDSISNIYSSHQFNYALNKSENKVYSWGFGESYVLGNKKDEGEEIPFLIPKEFFKNRIIDQVNNIIIYLISLTILLIYY